VIRRGRRFERDLHDGAQQHVVSLALQLRGVQLLVESDQHQLNEQLSLAVSGFGAISDELREISRGMHPAILSRGGLRAAIKGLARRSAVPVELDLQIDRRMSDQVEVVAYYIVAEALTNAAKYAQASEVTVRANVEDGTLRLIISDDEIGGAAVGGGSGLIGLQDRVEVLGGSFGVDSPDGVETMLVASIPVEARGPQPK
jgi:signal transduction histidine kinase